ncbi:MAG TPA: YraN family protein [Bacteroidota bacterium]|nr:YraN family protein [Bacteroidota bacterium]
MMAGRGRSNQRKVGERAETLAKDFLERAGIRIIERNYRFERGEIDLIGEDGEELVFIEVKARWSKAFGDPEDAITPQKEDQIKKTAEGYLVEHGIEDRAVRFDVVAITFEGKTRNIRHIKDAF